MPQEAKKSASEHRATQPASPSVPSKNAAILVFGTIADTTWRMFVPSVGGAILGVWADNQYGTKPWLTIAGVTFGIMIVFWLVWLQIKANTKE